LRQNNLIGDSHAASKSQTDPSAASLVAKLGLAQAELRLMSNKYFDDSLSASYFTPNRRTEVLPQYMEAASTRSAQRLRASPLQRTFHVLSRGFIPANPEWLSSYNHKSLYAPGGFVRESSTPGRRKENHKNFARFAPMSERLDVF
jgi:hypothetical protein